jgi:hypothetical protein
MRRQRMIECGRRGRIGLGTLAVAILLGASGSQASDAFIHQGKMIHPGCVHALAMSTGDAIPVTTAISLLGCERSERSKPKMIHEGDTVGFEDETLLGEGRFTYRHLSTLDNGLFILGIRRSLPDGSEHVSLAAVAIASRPVLRSREVQKQPVLEMIGEVWIKDLQVASLRTSGNVVHYSAGVGASRVDRTVDLSRIGKAVK